MPDSAELKVPAPVTIERVPLREALAAGANRTVTVQLLFAPRLLVQVVETKLKSAPVTDAAAGTETLTLLVPLLVSVAMRVADAPTATLPKFSVGVSAAA